MAVTKTTGRCREEKVSGITAEQLEEINRKLETLERENAQLKEWQLTMNQIVSQMLELAEAQKGSGEKNTSEIMKLWEFVSINRWRVDSLPYELRDPDYQSFFFKPHILSLEETRKQLITEKKSIARFGDGEFAAIACQKRWNFQGVSKWLSEKLLQVLQTNEEGFLIGLHSTFYRNLEDLPELDADGIRAYLRPDVRRLHAKLLSRDQIYAEALFHRIVSEEDVRELKKLWDGQKCVFIEGVHTGMGVGNDLFDNCDQIERILCPAENAVDRYDEIMNEALKQPKDKLILLALGPTATALSYDLYKSGYRSIDAGHIDLVYEKYIRGFQDLYRVKIPYKYCSADERNAGRAIEEIRDKAYLEQVVARIY